MNDDLREAITRMAAALEGATDVMSRLVVAMECLKECQDDDEEDEGEDTDLMVLELANKTRWRLYDSYLYRALKGTKFRAALLDYGYSFVYSHTIHDALKYRLNPGSSLQVIQMDLGTLENLVVKFKDFVFEGFTGTAYGFVIFSELGLIAYQDFSKPAVGHGGTLTVITNPCS